MGIQNCTLRFRSRQGMEWSGHVELDSFAGESEFATQLQALNDPYPDTRNLYSRICIMRPASYIRTSPCPTHTRAPAADFTRAELRLRYSVSCLALFILLLVGCSPRSDRLPTAPVSGLVTLDGRPAVLQPTFCRGVSPPGAGYSQLEQPVDVSFRAIRADRRGRDVSVRPARTQHVLLCAALFAADRRIRFDTCVTGRRRAAHACAEV